MTHVQVLVDIATPREAFERVDAVVAAHLGANGSEFTGKHLVVANFASDPLKFMLCVWWEYAHTGAPGFQDPKPKNPKP
jgi:hypothetical protein